MWHTTYTSSPNSSLWPLIYYPARPFEMQARRKDKGEIFLEAKKTELQSYKLL